jgi:hypothetical protein
MDPYKANAISRKMEKRKHNLDKELVGRSVDVVVILSHGLQVKRACYYIPQTLY